MEALLGHRMNVHDTESHGSTPRMKLLGAIRRKLSIIFLDAGADVYGKIDTDKTPVFARLGGLDIMIFLSLDARSEE